MAIRVVQLVAERMPYSVNLGRYQEDGPTMLRVDCGRWVDNWPGITISIRLLRPGEQTTYTVSGTLADGIYTYYVTATDTAISGGGLMEIVGVSGGHVVASVTAHTVIAQRMEGLEEGEDPPAPVQSWYTQALAAASDSEAYGAGTRGGSPVDEDDPAYHHNAAYYSGQMAECVTGSVDGTTLVLSTIGG